MKDLHVDALSNCMILYVFISFLHMHVFRRCRAIGSSTDNFYIFVSVRAFVCKCICLVEYNVCCIQYMYTRVITYITYTLVYVYLCAYLNRHLDMNVPISIIALHVSPDRFLHTSGTAWRTQTTWRRTFSSWVRRPWVVAPRPD